MKSPGTGIKPVELHIKEDYQEDTSKGGGIQLDWISTNWGQLRKMDLTGKVGG